jgi:hypothetical protein
VKSFSEILYDHLITQDMGTTFTSRDIDQALGRGSSQASAALIILERAGIVKRVGTLPTGPGCGKGRARIMWQLVSREISCRFNRAQPNRVQEGRGPFSPARSTAITLPTVPAPQGTLSDRLLALAIEAEGLRPLKDIPTDELAAELRRRQGLRLVG